MPRAFLSSSCTAVLAFVLRGAASGADTQVADLQPGGQLSSNGQELDPSISADGRWIAFASSANNLVPGVTGGVIRIYLRDLATKKTVLVSRTSNGLVPATFDSNHPSISADGRYVAFQSSSALVPNSPSPASAVYRFDRVTNQVECASLDAVYMPRSAQLGAGGGRRVSADGNLIVFHSSAHMLPGQTDSFSDVFVRNRATQKTILISKPSAGSPNGSSTSGSISLAGFDVLFKTNATNLAGTTGAGIYVKNTTLGTVKRVDVDSQGAPIAGALATDALALAGAAGQAAFVANAANPSLGDPDGGWDVYVVDLAGHEVDVISRGMAGQPSDDACYAPDLSDDGRYVVYQTFASNLVPWDANGAANGGDLILHDRATDRNAIMNVSSTGAQGTGGNCANASISGDGRWVTFVSWQVGLVAGDTTHSSDVFRRDRIGFTNLGYGKAGVTGIPLLEGVGSTLPGGSGTIELELTAPNAPALLMVSLDRGTVAPSSGPLQGTTLVTAAPILVVAHMTDAAGAMQLPYTLPVVTLVPESYAQFAIADSHAYLGVAASNALLLGF